MARVTGAEAGRPCIGGIASKNPGERPGPGPGQLDYILLKTWAEDFTVADVDTLTRRVLAEFEEMPGMALTRRQAARLFGLEHHLCGIVIDSLLDAAYLRETSGGAIKLGDRVAAIV